jgi:predicted glycosyltransferase involved in capsule biosynthesis
MDLFDVSAIIPVRGRNDFAEPMYKSFSVAAAKSGLKISYTMVEHSENPEHSKFCKKNRLNYIWIKSEPGELFNKCLAQNMGALFSSKSKYILFHDIDCLMQSDFFVRLFKNIRDKKARAIQNFTGRRVLYINPELTQKVIAGEFEVDDLSVELNEVNPPHIIGAPGGSITIERDLFFEIGGYDPEFFLANSPEDAFFWEKVNAIDKMYTSDAPDIELYHMFHPPTWNDNPYISGMLKIQNEFKSMNLEQKKEMIMLKAEAIKKFK